MIDFSEFYAHLKESGLRDFCEDIRAKVDKVFTDDTHGHLEEWLSVIDEMPVLRPLSVDLCADVVRVGEKRDCSDETRDKLEKKFKALHPWRKGPFEVFGIYINTEWRSDLKWARLKDDIRPLKGKLVLDVGCGNGYHCFRMAGEGARAVVGVDPFQLFVCQFEALNKYIQTDRARVLPLGIEDMPDDAECFDTIFSMGVLYHRKDAEEHVRKLKGLLKKGGELVLETLILESDEEEVFQPEGRYAKMRNVWNIPSPEKMVKWLRQAGLSNCRMIDATRTTFEEQRPTEWMVWESLPDFLDKDNPEVTIEGYQGPVRAIFLADK